MSLNKLFNKNYAIQNIKKSKGILAIMPLIILVITIFILYGYRVDNRVSLPVEIGYIALPNIIGMFVIPFIISNVLMGYVYKQNSIDFVNSMPMSRKKAYLTNIITGSIYILALQLFNLIIQTIFILLANTYVIFSMLFDIFIMMLIGYLFVYAICSLALAISGNRFTQIVVSLLILFIIPFTRIICLTYIDYGTVNVISENNTIVDYAQYSGMSRVYTVPINVFQTYPNQIYSLKSLLFTSVICLIYVIIGMELFEKRKMENNGFSFYSKNIHLFVKGLTLYPMIHVVKLLFYSDSILDFDFEFLPHFIFVLAVIFIYYLVYDLITNKKIKLLTNIFSFIISFIVLTIIVSGIYYVYEKKNEIINIEANNIEKIALSIESVFYVDDRIEKITISDKDIINYIFNNSSGRPDDSEEKSFNDFYGTFMILYTKSGKKVKINSYMYKDEYKVLIQKLINNDEYIKAAANIYKTSNYAYYSNEMNYYSYINLNKYPKFKNFLNDNAEELVKLKLKNSIENKNNYDLRFRINTYKNHNCYSVSILMYRSELLNELVRLQNEVFSDELKNLFINEKSYRIGYNFEKNDNGKTIYLRNIYYQDGNGDIYNFIIENKNNDVDLSKSYYKIEANRYVFYTNEIEKIDEIIKKHQISESDFVDYYDDIEYVDSIDNENLNTIVDEF